MKLYKRVWNNRINYLYIFPIIVVYFIFAFLPIIQTTIMSFHDSNIITKGPFVGLSNYRTILVSEEFQQTIANTMMYTVVSIIFTIGIALMLSVFYIYAEAKRKDPLQGPIFSAGGDQSSRCRVCMEMDTRTRSWHSQQSHCSIYQSGRAFVVVRSEDCPLDRDMGEYLEMDRVFSCDIVCQSAID